MLAVNENMWSASVASSLGSAFCNRRCRLQNRAGSNGLTLPSPANRMAKPLQEFDRNRMRLILRLAAGRVGFETAAAHFVKQRFSKD